MKTAGIDVVKACLQAYVANDRATLEGCLAPDYTFTSSFDNQIALDEYFAVCWPNSRNITRFEVIKYAETADTVFVIYECQTSLGKTFRNCEVFKLRGEMVISTEVYFGWDVPHPVNTGEHHSGRQKA